MVIRFHRRWVQASLLWTWWHQCDPSSFRAGIPASLLGAAHCIWLLVQGATDRTPQAASRLARRRTQQAQGARRQAMDRPALAASRPPADEAGEADARAQDCASVLMMARAVPGRAAVRPAVSTKRCWLQGRAHSRLCVRAWSLRRHLSSPAMVRALPLLQDSSVQLPTPSHPRSLACRCTGTDAACVVSIAAPAAGRPGGAQQESLPRILYPPVFTGDGARARLTAHSAAAPQRALLVRAVCACTAECG